MAAKVIVLTSGKGGVGKTTSAAAVAAGLALRGHRTVVIDFDVGLRNLDLIMGCERRVVFDFINVINGDAKLNQALIKDKRNDSLYVFPTSQTRDKDALKREGVERVLDELKESFDYIICDSPAGIEHGAITALYFADEAIIVTNPEVSSVRDSDRIIGILASKSRRAEHNMDPVAVHLLLTRYSPERVEKGEMLAIEDVKEILSIPLLGVDPGIGIGAARLEHRHPGGVRRGQPGGPSLSRRCRPPARRSSVNCAFYEPERRSFFRSLFGARDAASSIFCSRSAETPPRSPATGLKIVLAHERASSAAPDFLPALQKDLLDVVGRYIDIRDDMLRVNVARSGETSLLEINVELDGATVKPVKNGAAKPKRRPPRSSCPKPDPGSHPPWVKPS